MPITVAVTMPAATRIPVAMAAKAGRNRKPRRKAIAHPLQAPVMGRGMATKMVTISPKLSCPGWTSSRTDESQLKNLSQRANRLR